MSSEDVGIHRFTIPVMGTAFTVDSPLRVARYGISSAISLVDDLLLEQMRKHHSAACGDEYVPIKNNAPDGRALRVTAYLDFLDRQIAKQIDVLRSLPFDEGSDICRYFELLPDGPLRTRYLDMQACPDEVEKLRMQAALREEVLPGAINANIMTKLDRDRDRRGRERPLGDSDALAAARGFSNSTVDGSLILSAGMNPRLFTYISTLEGFQPDDAGVFKKRLVLKVSDYRSAEIQGKVFAKKGVWVSEFRIESGLNCGGHAFATLGVLIGPILEEFKAKRAALSEQLMGIYNKARKKAGVPTFTEPLTTHVTYQGGLGTADEQRFVLDHYEVDSTGWGTPFLLVPEATNLDPETREALSQCKDDEIQLGPNSPLGVPFWNYTNSPSERARRANIASGKPGTACPKGHLAVHVDFQEPPLCRASRAFQSHALEALEASDLASEVKEAEREAIQDPSCICHDLAGCATLDAGIDKRATPAICPGPNIVNFRRIFSLDEMVGHIYGRCNLMLRADRPHFFLRELELYLDNFTKQMAEGASRLAKYRDNLLAGIDYYRALAADHLGEHAGAFLVHLEALLKSLPSLEEGGPSNPGSPAPRAVRA